jgi:hypothetical protein
MPFNINEFKANIEDFGYLKTNQFEVLVTPPPILFGDNLNMLGTPTAVGDVLYNSRFRIEQVKAPGISLTSSDIARYGIGTTQKQPFNAQFSDLTFSILVDGYGDTWQFWYNWIRAIYEFNGTESSFFGFGNSLPTYTLEYKENYATTMQIVIYDTYGNSIQRLNLYDAFPSSLRDIQLGWDSSNNLMRISVSITYSGYTLVGSVLEGFSAIPLIAGAVSEIVNSIIS